MGVWQGQLARLSQDARLLPVMSSPEAFLALCAALDARYVTPANTLSIAWGDDRRYWRPAHEHTAVHGALRPEGAMHCVNVCWFDVNAELELPPGIWLLRVRIKFLYGHIAPTERLSLRTSSQQPGVYVTPVPEELTWNVSPSAGSRWALVGVDKFGPRAATCVEHLSSYFNGCAQRWCFRPAAVVHVRGVGPASVNLRVSKTSDTLWLRDVFIDCIQAVPLHDEMRWPVNGASALEGNTQVLGELVEPELGTAHCLTVPV